MKVQMDDPRACAVSGAMWLLCDPRPVFALRAATGTLRRFAARLASRSCHTALKTRVNALVAAKAGGGSSSDRTSLNGL